MLKKFGWKAIEGILIANGLYYFMYRKHLRALEEKFQFRRVKDEIRTTHLCRNEMEKEFDRIVPAIDEELQFRKKIETKIEKVSTHVRNHLEPQYLEKVAASGVDKELAHKAFERRFEEKSNWRACENPSPWFCRATSARPMWTPTGISEKTLCLPGSRQSILYSWPRPYSRRTIPPCSFQGCCFSWVSPR